MPIRWFQSARASGEAHDATLRPGVKGKLVSIRARLGVRRATVYEQLGDDPAHVSIRARLGWGV